jgi:hypothetical protein
VFTLFIRYTLDPRKLADFEAYARALPPFAERCGGKAIKYFLPTNFAGPTDAAFGLIDFQSLAVYEEYRERLSKDREAMEITRKAMETGCILREERSFVRAAGG